MDKMIQISKVEQDVLLMLKNEIIEPHTEWIEY